MSNPEADRVIQLRDEIQEAKEKLAVARDHLKSTEDDLKTNFGVKTLEEAHTLLKDIEKRIQSRTVDLNCLLDNLEKVANVTD